MKNKITRLICLVLACMFSLFAFAGCVDDNDNDEVKKITGTGEDRFAGTDFKGKKITIAVSTAQDADRIGASAQKYMTGFNDDGSENTTDYIVQEVKKRNDFVKTKLNLNVEYYYMSETYDTLPSVIETKYNAHDGFADAISNQTNALVPCMMKGFFRNVNDKTNVTNYFDFSDGNWYDDAMSALSFGQEMDGKMFLLASDYFIDIIRCINIMYVNEDLIKSVTDYEPEQFYGLITDKLWTYDQFYSFVERGYDDTNGSIEGPDADDNFGYVYAKENNLLSVSCSMVATYSADVDYIKSANGTLSYDTTNTVSTLMTLSDKISSVLKLKGAYANGDEKGDRVADVTTVRTIFAKNKTLFCSGLKLYDMENQMLSSINMTPIPLPLLSDTDEYRTMVHDNASIGAIFKTGDFEKVSAFWQYCTIKSEPTRLSYYENGLGIKYGSNANTTEMLDIIYDNMIVSQSYAIESYLYNKNGEATPIHSLLWGASKSGSGSINSSWQAVESIKKNALATAISDYNNIQ